LPILHRFVAPLAVCLFILPAPKALAWDAPAGSPPDWHSYWVQTTRQVEVFIHADGDATFGSAPEGVFFRVDAPELYGRLWVYDPLDDSWAWVDTDGTQTVHEPTPDEIDATAPTLEPRDYLYRQAPDLAPRLDCIINGESGWDPNQQNRSTRAAGLAQFLPSTWAATPQGQEGLSPFEPLPNIDAAIWLARTKGWTQWQVYVQGRCH
jgi:hypothetical protein